MATPLSRTFKSLKPHSNSLLPPITKPLNSSQIPPNILPQLHSSNKPSSSASTSSPENPWAVYLILSTNPPIKTYVGVTNNFSRRLKQHNGELIGGAKASRAGRPWACACLIQGFLDKSSDNEENHQLLHVLIELDGKELVAVPGRLNRVVEEVYDMNELLSYKSLESVYHYCLKDSVINLDMEMKVWFAPA